MFAASSMRHLTCSRSLPPYTSSAFSQRQLNICVYIILRRKFRLPSVSDIMRYSMVFLSPILSSSSSSYIVISRTSAISKGASLAAAEMRIDFAVLPAASLYFLYCLTAKCSGSLDSRSSNIRSIAFLKESSSSWTSILFRRVMSALKFCSSGGASYQIYPMRAQYNRVSAFSQNGSDDLPSPLVFEIRTSTSFSTSFSL